MNDTQHTIDQFKRLHSEAAVKEMAYLLGDASEANAAALKGRLRISDINSIIQRAESIRARLLKLDLLKDLS